MPVISISTPPHPLGVVITVSSTANITGTRTAYVATKALLDTFVASKLCKYDEKTVGGAAWPNNTGRKFIINTAGKRTAKAIKDAIIILDNEKYS